MTRRARPASSGSWVTRTSVVPCSRFSSPRRATTFGPFAASRLPVGSSAKRILGPVDEGPRHRHALLLAARELRRVVVPAVAQSHPREQLLRAGPPVLAPQLERDLDVLAGGERRDEVEGLEDEADRLRPHPGPLVLAPGVARSRPSSTTRPRVGPVEPGEQAEERALAASRRAGDGQEAAGLELERDISENGDLAPARDVGPGERLAAQDGHEAVSAPSHASYRQTAAALAGLAVLGGLALGSVPRALAGDEPSAVRRPRARRRPRPAPADDRPVILFVGTSLTAGYGLDPSEAYPRSRPARRSTRPACATASSTPG